MAAQIARRAVLFAGGEVKDYSAVKSMLMPNDYLIAVDSGYEHCLAVSAVPDIIVGDFDSISKIPKDIKTVKLSKEKKYTDLYHAIEIALDMQFYDIIIIGALGGRVDHSLGNLQLAVLASYTLSVKLFDGYNEICILNAEKNPAKLILSPQKKAYFSVVSHRDNARSVSIHGAKYALDSYDLTNIDPRAISNEFIGSEVLITADSGVLLVCIEPIA